MTLFKNNMKIIKEQNSLLASNSEKYGFNKFTDSTKEEYLKFLTATKKEENINFDLLADLEIKEFEHLLLNA